MEGNVREPPENSNVVVKDRYNKGEFKANKIILDSLGDHSSIM